MNVDEPPAGVESGPLTDAPLEAPQAATVATLVISRNVAFAEHVCAGIEASGRSAMQLERCPVVVAQKTMEQDRIAGERIGLADWAGPDFDTIVLDLHTGPSTADHLAGTPGLGFLSHLQSHGCRLPVLMLTWYELDVFRYRRLCSEPGLFRRYSTSYRLLRLPVEAGEVVEAIEGLMPLSLSELRRIAALRDELPYAHGRGR